MANPLRIKRGTRAQINAAKAANGLAAGEPYLVTDEDGRLELGTAANTSTAMATKAEVDSKTLVSGTNIKTVNGASLVGAGNLDVASTLVRATRSSNTQIVAANNGGWIDITSGTFTQTFAACSALGDGWWCYLGNSGTGDITLDLNSAETIDGLASFVMYPGEIRLVQCDGSTLRSIVVKSFLKVFTSSGTFTKPPGYALFDSLTWSGGNSGRKETGPGTNAPGGGGGGCFSARIPAASLSATTTITVGAGGAARTTLSDGALGGDSSIGTLVVVAQSATYSNGGAVKLGTAALASSGSTADGFGYASGGAGNAVWGGGAANQTATVYGSLYGGAGGGGYVGGSIRAPGSSVFGGAGGTGALMGNATDGTAPGGGGGGAYNGNSGAGARGEVQIWGLL